MTNEEAIKHLKWFSEYNEDEYCGGDRIQKGADWYYYINKEDFEAFDVAIKALEQIPDLKEAYNKGYKDGQEALAFHLELCKEEQEPCEDCISRQAVLEAFNLSEKTRKYGGDHSGYDTMMLYEIQDVIESLPSIQPTAKENLVVGDCMKREFIEIVVDYPPADLCTYPEYRGKPYFSIKYRENGKTYVGFGTYKIEMLSQWIKEYFMPSIQPKSKADVLDKIRAEIHATAEMHRDGDYYLRDEWIDKIIDKYIAESENKG